VRNEDQLERGEDENQGKEQFAWTAFKFGARDEDGLMGRKVS
jgi:hypothetical protein